MTAQWLDGRAVARSLASEIARDAAVYALGHERPATLAIVQVGDDLASSAYVTQIQRACLRAGMCATLHALPAYITPAGLEERIRALNADAAVHGILVQMPLPGPLADQPVAEWLAPHKDVDGIHPLNAGRLMQGLPDHFVPATPAGGMELLRRYNIPLQGRRAVVVGRSNTVGRPMALLLLHAHATVTICHSRTPDLAAVTRQAEILAVAVGKPRLITGEMIAPGAVVVDFGVNVLPDGSMVGDVDTASAEQVAGWLTPVPGGTGPMTNVLLLRNLLAAAWH